MTKSFNNEILLMHRQWRFHILSVLYLSDQTARYSSSCVNYNKKEEIVRKLQQHWIIIFLAANKF